jgi:hypothetical protein
MFSEDHMFPDTRIKQGSFQSYYNLAELDFSLAKSLIEISRYAFKYCTFRTIDFSGAEPLAILNERAFEYCSNLQSVKMSSNRSIKYQNP